MTTRFFGMRKDGSFGPMNAEEVNEIFQWEVDQYNKDKASFIREYSNDPISEDKMKLLIAKMDEILSEFPSLYGPREMAKWHKEYRLMEGES